MNVIHPATQRLLTWVAPRCGAALILLAAMLPSQAQTVNWVGGNLYKRWNDPLNWSPQTVPTNSPGTNFTVLVPAGASISYLSDLVGSIDALSFGDGSVLDIAEDSQLEVTGVGMIRGTIQTDGAGSAFRATGDGVVLDAHPRFLARNGSTIATRSSSYSWSRYDGNADLLLADTGSVLDLQRVSSFVVSYGSGRFTYNIRAAEGGVIDLSGLATLSGPSDDDWLDVHVNTGGNIRLDSLQQVSGRVRFNVRIPAYELSKLRQASATEFIVGSNVVLALPSLLRLQTGRIVLDANSEFRSPALLSVSDATIDAGAGSALLLGQLDSIANTTVNIGEGAILDAPRLTVLDTVPLNLSGTGALVATNLIAYRNSDIPIVPGRAFQPGILTDIYASRISVSQGMGFRVGANSYSTPGDWRSSPTLLSADGAGSLLAAASVRSMLVYGGGYRQCNYSVVASRNGVVDLSGLQTATGPKASDWDQYSDDWLVFSVGNGGSLLLGSLQQVRQSEIIT